MRVLSLVWIAALAACNGAAPPVDVWNMSITDGGKYCLKCSTPSAVHSNLPFAAILNLASFKESRLVQFDISISASVSPGCLSLVRIAG